MAVVPLPGTELTLDAGRHSTDLATAIPAAVHGILGTLWSAGFAAYVVGGAVRDGLLGRPTRNWDLATSAVPDEVVALFPSAVYENKFGTVVVHSTDETLDDIEITTFRTDHDYADFRRPHRVEFGTSLELDLARRDFTVNAMAWGAEPGGSPSLVDPHDGRGDLAAHLLRGVGDPAARFAEDALRMVRAVRLAATLGFGIEAGTLAGIQAQAKLVRHLSGERIAAELSRLLAAERPSIGLRLMSDTGLLAPVSPDLAAQRGVPQNKVPGEDLWDHTIRAVDAAPGEPPLIRMATLLHDIGKPATMADGRFLGHETVGAALADAFLERLRWPLAERALIVRLVRHHMFGYLPSWSDAAVRRLMAKVGRDELNLLFLLREADNIGSGLAAGAGGLDELRDRVARQLAAGVALDLAGLVVDGTDLMAELGIDPGPLVGRILDALLERVIADPSLNSRDVLLALARQMRIGMGATQRGTAT